MKKVRLIVDELQVQSFTTDHETRARGTVQAHDAPTDEFECPTADAAYNTCWGSCENSCGCPGPSADCSVDCWYTLDWNCMSDLDCMYTYGGRTPSDC